MEGKYLLRKLPVLPQGQPVVINPESRIWHGVNQSNEDEVYTMKLHFFPWTPYLNVDYDYDSDYVYNVLGPSANLLWLLADIIPIR